MSRDNPFTATTFVDYWSKHFLKEKKTHSFSFVKNLSFYESKLPGVYVNAGKNLTKGIHFEMGESSGEEEKGKTFLIYDVIDSGTQKKMLTDSRLRHYVVRQYPGYLIDLESYNTLDDFLSKTFKKSSRYKLRKYKKRLEECFDISFKAYNGEMSKEEYDTVFFYFRKLLKKRFEEKQISNNNLNTEEWDFYKDVAYPLILEKKASLFVLYKNEAPISITLTYLSENRIFDAITVFDIDYAKFNLGSIKIMYLVDWCLKNGWKILDFSKGHFDYKTRWSNKKFDFHYHIWFDKKSPRAKLIAYGLKQFFTFKQYLRERKVNERLHRFTYALKNKKTDDISYSFTEWKDQWGTKEMRRIDIDTVEYSYLKGMCYDFLYLHQEHLKNLQVFKKDNLSDFFLLVGEHKKVGLKLII